MKFAISSSILSQRLQTLGRVIASKNSMPILDNFLFQVHDNHLELTASDSELTLHTTLELIESDGPIDFTVNAKTIQDAIKEIPEQPLEFTVDPDNLDITVTYQNGHYNLVGQNAQEYPLTPDLEGDISTLGADAARLFSGINRALFAAADDPLRPVMNGVFFDFNTDGLAVVASDGRKLSCTRLLDVTTDTPASFILHKKPANIVRNILQKEVGDVTIRFNGRNAVIASECYDLSCRLIEGKFPNYNSVIPTSSVHNIIVDKDQLFFASKRVSLFSNRASSLVILDFADDSIRITGQDLDLSIAAEETISCSGQQAGTRLRIGFDFSYLQRLLQNVASEQIQFSLNDQTRAGVITPITSDEGIDITALIIPMKLLGE